jgi:protein SCO1
VKFFLASACLFLGTTSLAGQDLLSKRGNALSKPANVLPPALSDVGVDQKLNNSINLDLQFRDESGRDVPLRVYFGKRPVILAPVYYQCPMLCTQILNGLVSALKPVSFNPGQEFDVIAVSFDPDDTPEAAAVKKHNYMRRYGREGAERGFHFLSGDEPEIKELMDSVGFRYVYDEKTDQFAHASALILITPEGKISRYYYGVDYSPRDLKFGLIEASKNKIGSPVEQALLFCFHYDPSTGKYTPYAIFSLRVLAAGMVFGLGTFLFVMFRRESNRRPSA